MKFILLIILFILPIVAHAANTNAFNNVLINNSLTHPGRIATEAKTFDNTWTNRGSLIILTNLTVNGTITGSISGGGGISGITNLNFDASPASITNYYNGSSSLGFTTTTIQFGQAQTNTFTVTGAAAGDKIIQGWPAALPVDSVWRMNVTSANTISVIRIALVNPVVTFTDTFTAGVVKDK